jgi:hypothetical protein
MQKVNLHERKNPAKDSSKPEMGGETLKASLVGNRERKNTAKAA